MSATDTSTRVLRSAGAATFSQMWRVTVTLITHLFLRRWIEPSHWGVFDWAEVVFLLLGGLRDFGLSSHVLRVRRPRPFGNLLVVEAGWGAVLALLAAVCAPLIARGFSDTSLLIVPVLRAMALFLLLEGLAKVPSTYFDGELLIGKSVVPEIARNLCFATVSITLAMMGHGIWSIVWGHVSGAALYATLLWRRALPTIELTFLPGRTLSLLWESRNLALAWLLSLLVRYVDRLVLGAQFDSSIVGAYGFAYWAAFIVPTIMLFPVARAAYPAFVQFRDDPPRLFGTYRIATLFLLSLEVPAAFLMFFNANLVLRLIGGSRWVVSPKFLVVLCFAILLDPLSRFGGEVLMAHHRERWWIVANLSTLASFLIGGILLTRIMGPIGMAWANYLPLGGLIIAWSLYRLDPKTVRTLFKDLVFVYAVPIPIFLIVALATPPQSQLRLALSLLAALLSLVVYWLRFGKGFKNFFFADS